MPIVQGVQSKGVAATVKHFACNNQETERMTISSEVDERTLQEIYLPAFKAAVHARPRLGGDVRVQQTERHVLQRERLAAESRR